MDCADTLETIEVAASEPDGLERLMAGDTPEAAAVAGHLAACAACADALARVGRSAATVRAVLASMPDDGLRERTLAYVRALGRSRTLAPAAAGPAGAGTGSTAAGTPARGAARPAGPAVRRLRVPLGWAAGVAVAAVLAAGLTAAFVVPGRDAQIARQADEIALLSRVTAWTVRVEARPDARRVALVGAGGDAGSLVYSPSTGELVVVAAGLPSPPPDREYECWLRSEAGRTKVGRMGYGGDLAGWAGAVEGLEEMMEPGAMFEVSLGPDEASPSDLPVLWGRP